MKEFFSVLFFLFIVLLGIEANFPNLHALNYAGLVLPYILWTAAIGIVVGGLAFLIYCVWHVGSTAFSRITPLFTGRSRFARTHAEIKNHAIVSRLFQISLGIGLCATAAFSLYNHEWHWYFLVFGGLIYGTVNIALFFFYQIALACFPILYEPTPPAIIPSSQWPFKQRWEYATKHTAEIFTQIKEYADTYVQNVPRSIFDGMRQWGIERFLTSLKNDGELDAADTYVFLVLQHYVDDMPKDFPAVSYLSVPLGNLVPPRTDIKDAHVLYDPLVPYIIPQELKYEGMWIPCGPGSGKTNLLHCMVNDAMQEVREKRASVFLMDSKSNDKKGLIDTWRNVDFAFNWGIENVYIFDPDDKLAINIFDLGDIDQIVNLFEYMLSDLVGFELTGYQKLLLTNCLHVVKKSDRPSIPALFDLIENGWRPYEYAIRKVRPHIQNFFIKPNPDPRSPKKLRSAFDNSQGADTRLQVGTRLNALLSIDKLYDTLVSETTEIDLRKLIDDSSVIIVNAKISDLGAKGSEFWQRLWTMLLLEAGRKRESEIPLYCFFDEAHRGIARDTKIPEILSELRSANVAVTISHQGAWQIEDARVTSALENMSAIILKETKVQGVFMAAMRRADPKAIHVEHFDLNRLPRMSRRKARAQKAKTREAFHGKVPGFVLPQITHIKDTGPEILYPSPAEEEPPPYTYTEAAEPEPEPFKYTKKPIVTDAEYTVIEGKPDPAPSDDDPIIRDILERYRLLPEPPQPNSLPSPGKP